MDSDLLTEARALAERGWLPGIHVTPYKHWSESHACVGFGSGLYIQGSVVGATEADLHLAAHNEIVRRGWIYQVDDGTNVMVPNTELWCYDNGTTTLSLLRALRRAIEATETPNGS